MGSSSKIRHLHKRGADLVLRLRAKGISAPLRMPIVPYSIKSLGNIQYQILGCWDLSRLGGSVVKVDGGFGQIVSNILLTNLGQTAVLVDGIYEFRVGGNTESLRSFWYMEPLGFGDDVLDLMIAAIDCAMDRLSASPSFD